MRPTTRLAYTLTLAVATAALVARAWRDAGYIRFAYAAGALFLVARLIDCFVFDDEPYSKRPTK